MEALKEYLPQSILGKNALISGGTTGIGRATALMLAHLGANVIVFGRHQQELDDMLKDAQSLNLAGTVTGITADVGIENDIKKVFYKIDSEFSSLDILVNNAAISYEGIMKGSFTNWEYALKTNVLGYMACSHEAIVRMKKEGSGHIINIGSISADLRSKGSSVYTATKSAIQGFSEALRKEVNDIGIKVSLIEPGLVGSDMQESTPEEQTKKIESMEMLKAEDIAVSIIYCLSQPPRCDVISLQIRPHLQII